MGGKAFMQALTLVIRDPNNPRGEELVVAQAPEVIEDIHKDVLKNIVGIREGHAAPQRN